MTEALLNIKKSINKQSETIIYILLGVLTYFLSIHFSKDWFYYQYFFDKKIEAIDWSTFLSQITVFKEPLYIIPSKFFGELFSFSFFILITTVTLLVVKLNFLKKVTQVDYTVGLFFYICFYLLLFEGTQLRIAYATCFIMVALYFLQKERFILSFFMIVLASQIHLTALIFIIALPLYFFRSLNVAVCIFAIISPLFILLDISWFGLAESIITKLNPKYIFYFKAQSQAVQNSTGLYYFFVFFYASLLMVVFYYLKDSIKRNQFIKTIFSTALCGFIAMCVFYDFVAVGARLGELLMFTTVIMLSYLYQLFNLHKKKLEQRVLITVSLLYFVARIRYLYPKLLTIQLISSSSI